MRYTCWNSVCFIAFNLSFITKVSAKNSGLPRQLSCREPTYQCRRCRFNPWVGRFPGGGNGNPLQYPCLENPMDKGAWWATVTKSPTHLSDWALMKLRTQKLRGRIIFSPIVWLLWCNFHFYDSSIATSILLSALELGLCGSHQPNSSALWVDVYGWHQLGSTAFWLSL